MSEALLTDELLLRLASDFEFKREVCGEHPISGNGVRIDLLAKGKAHLVELGFTDEWFGIECKWADRLSGTTSKTTRMVWQSITYAQSLFTVDGTLVRPKFVAVYTPDNLHSLIEVHLKHLSPWGSMATLVACISIVMAAGASSSQTITPVPVRGPYTLMIHNFPSEGLVVCSMAPRMLSLNG